MSQKLADKFHCEACDYTCSKNSDMNKHYLTRKHKTRISRIELSQKAFTPVFICANCNKEYNARNSLWYHQRKCKSTSENVNTSASAPTNTFVEPPPTPIANPNDQLILELLAKNKELMEMLIIQNKELQNRGPTTINQTTNNNNNQRFNINVFLNERCKDAINFSDFVNNIQISYEDLENNAHLGFVNGISKIFLDNLKQLDVTERPIHCTDVKRETMYIKDENIWTKQPDDEKLQKAIQTVSYRGMGKLAEWKKENPDYKDCNSEFSQKCVDIQLQTLAGSNRSVYYPKVIHTLARETVVDK